MRAGLRSALAAAALLLALAGCKTAPPPAPVIGPGADAPWPEQQAALQRLDRYTLAGRVAVAAGDQGFSGSLRYRRNPTGAEMAIDGPMGMGGLRVVEAGEALEITTARGENFDGEAAREEIERRLGFELPVDNLRWWLLGVRAPAESGEVGAVPEAEPNGFEQQGWKVIVNAREPALGFSLPKRLTIERDGARFKVVVDQWLP